MSFVRAAAIVAIFLNAVAVGAWMYLNPPAAYERLADREMRAAHDAYRKVGAERSYALYHRIMTVYPRSTFATEARFFAARTAFLGLGKFDEAEKDFAAYVAVNPKSEANVEEAKDALVLIHGRTELQAAERDAVLWEYVQAVVEESNGKYASASARLAWISEKFGSTTIGKRATAALPRVVGKANEAAS